MNQQLSHLIEVTKAKKSQSGYIGHCPAHDDGHPSLSFDESADGKILVKCHAGCSFEDVVDAAGLLKPKSESKRESYVEQLWKEGRAISPESPISLRYLQRRGLGDIDLSQLTDKVKWLPHCRYYDHGSLSKENVVSYPALILALRDRNGSVKAVQRIYLSPDGTSKASVSGPKKVFGSYKGCSTIFGEPAVEVAVCEGPETALATFLGSKLCTVCVLSTGNMDNTTTLPQRAKIIHIFADRDASGAGQKAAEKLARLVTAEGRTAIIHLPPKIEGQNIDWADVYARDGSEPFKDSLKTAVPFTFDPPKSTWEPIGELPSFVPSVPTMSPELLPEPIRAYIVDGAERIGVPVEFIAINFICSVAATIGRSIAVQPKEHDTDWWEVPNLWGAIIGRPGKKKTPAMRYALRPFNGLITAEKKRVMKQQENNSEKIAELEAELQAIDQAIHKIFKESVKKASKIFETADLGVIL